MDRYASRIQDLQILLENEECVFRWLYASARHLRRLQPPRRGGHERHEVVDRSSPEMRDRGQVGANPLARHVCAVPARFRRPAVQGRATWAAQVSAFTYVSTWQGGSCQVFVFGVFARRIVGWRAGSSMRADRVFDALERIPFDRKSVREVRRPRDPEHRGRCLRTVLAIWAQTRLLHRPGLLGPCGQQLRLPWRDRRPMLEQEDDVKRGKPEGNLIY